MTQLYGLVFFFGFVLSLFLIPFSKKVRDGLLGRFGLLKRYQKNAKWSRGPYWFHVSSAGELEQCIPIMEAIKAQAPIPILLTYYSPSAKRAITLEVDRRTQWKTQIPWDYADYLPLDFRFCIRKFLDTVAPQAFIAINREIWPHLLEETKGRGIRCYLFASYFWPRSRKWIPLYGKWLKLFDFIGTTQEETTRHLVHYLKNANVATLGDPRIERVLRRQKFHTRPHWLSYFENQQIFLLGSLWPKDFHSVLPALSTLLHETPPWRMVLAPHSPSPGFVEELQDFFKKENSQVRLFSEWQALPDSSSHIVVDTVGQLAELYQIATLVFVGGSFTSRVHNVLEPAAYAKPVFTGPLITNSAEAIELNRENRGLFLINNAQELLDKLRDVTKDSQTLGRYAFSIRQYLLDRTDTAARYAAILTA